MREPISRLRIAAARVTVIRSSGVGPRGGGAAAFGFWPLLAERWEITVRAGHGRRAARPAIVGVVGGVVGHARMLVGRSITGAAGLGLGPLGPDRSRRRPDTYQFCPMPSGQPGVARQPSMDGRDGTHDRIRRESAVATVAEWPAELAAVLTDAVDQARAAVAEFSGPDTVGDYLGVGYEDPNAATHRFLAHLPGYQGWQWAVVVAAYPGAEPRHGQRGGAGPRTDGAAGARVGAVGAAGPAGGSRAPETCWRRPTTIRGWFPGYTASGDPQVDETAAEIGLGRRWVMGAWGRAEAAERWHDGDYGPDSAMARSTKRSAATADSSCRWRDRWARCSGYAATNCPPTGMSSTSSTVAAPTPTLRAPAGTGSPMYEPYDDGVLDVMETPPEPRRAARGRSGAAESSEPADEPPEAARSRPTSLAMTAEEESRVRTVRRARPGGHRQVATGRCSFRRTRFPVRPASPDANSAARARRTRRPSPASQPSAPIAMNGHAASSAGGSGGGSGLARFGAHRDQHSPAQARPRRAQGARVCRFCHSRRFKFRFRCNLAPCLTAMRGWPATCRWRSCGWPGNCGFGTRSRRCRCRSCQH